MTKTILKSFRYIECDDFASYLTQMSAGGWHFKEWKIGLVFEKGEPADISYAVEVFPKGSEMDVCASPDAKEYAEYCNAAGWKFLDSRQKFCIFRKDSPTAPPITTPGERLSNILRAQWQKWLADFFSAALLSGLYWLQFLLLGFSTFLFNNVLLLVLAILTLNFLTVLMQAGELFLRGRSYKAGLLAGKIPVYSTRRSIWAFRRGYFFFTLLLFTLLFTITWQSDRRAAVISAAVVLFLFLACLLISWRRPSREGNWFLQITLGLAIPFIAAIIAISCFSGSDDKTGDSFHAAVPLAPAVFGRCELKDFEFSQSIFGSMCRYSIDVYGTGAEGTAVSDPDGFWCYIYRSDHPEILNRIWKQKTKENSEGLSDCTGQWNALCALSDNTWQYYLKYTDRVIVIQTTLMNLNEAQRASLQETLLTQEIPASSQH